jgi:hypothetical protein
VGYAGYLVRVRPGRRLRGRLEVHGPAGEHLGSLRLPRRPRVALAAAGARGRGLVRLPWVAGEDRLMVLRVEMEVARPLWLAGLRAWAAPPEAVVCAEACWPYHLYPGPRPQRRVDLYDGTSFGAAGLTFTFRAARGRGEAEPGGVDLLRGWEEEAAQPEPAGDGAAGEAPQGRGALTPSGTG